MLYLVALTLYIAIEIFFRSYAIDLLGQSSLLSYELNTFEIFGRVLSASGFTIFLVTSLKNKLPSLKARVIFTLITFSSFYVFLNIVMNNVHQFVGQENRENAYYVNLFKQGVYDLEITSQFLPFERDEEDSLYKTFYGLSSFLYFGNDTAIEHAKRHEAQYLQNVAESQIDRDILAEEIKNAIFPTSIDNLKFMTVSALHYRDSSILEWRNIVQIHLVATAYHSYAWRHSRLSRLGVEMIPEHQQRPEIQALIQRIERAHGKGGFLMSRNDDLRTIQASRTRALFESLVYEFNKHHFDVFESMFKELIKQNDSSIAPRRSYSVYQSYHLDPIRTFDKENFLQFRYFHIRNAHSQQYQEAMKDIFSGISQNDLDILTKHWLYSRSMRDYFNSRELDRIYRTYDNNLTPPLSMAIAFQRIPSFNLRYGKSFRVEPYTESPQALYQLFVDRGYQQYPADLSNKFIEFHQQYLKGTKHDYKNNVKAVLIPPLVLLLLNIAIVLNFALLLTKLLSMKVENKKILYGFQATVTILIFILLGSNKGLDNERFTYFFDSYAKEYQHVSLTRAAAVAWFIRKNNFYNQYLKFGVNL